MHRIGFGVLFMVQGVMIIVNYSKRLLCFSWLIEHKNIYMVDDLNSGHLVVYAGAYYFITIIRRAFQKNAGKIKRPQAVL